MTAYFLTIIFVMELSLSFLPNIQVTTLLMIVFATNYKLKYVVTLTFGYVFLNGMAYGFSLYLVSMLVGWLVLNVTINLLHTRNLHVLTLSSLLFGLFYGMFFVPINVLLTGVDFWAYIMADIPFALLFAASNILTVLYLYKPIDKIVRKYG